MFGSFQDDYNINYQITKELWFQKPNARFHIVKWNLKEKHLIAQNDSENPSEPNLYTRFDWIKFEDMPEYEWGFCMSTYNSESIEAAAEIPPPDRVNPKDGCNGFPFSRMKPLTD